MDDLLTMMGDDSYNEQIFAMVDDIGKSSGAWDEFSRQITKEIATNLKQSMEGPTFKTDVKALFEKADEGNQGHVKYGSKSFQAFIDLCIEHFKLPKPKGGELVYRKLFNRFQSEKKLDLQECEVLVISMCHVIMRSFDLSVMSSIISEDIIEQIKASGAWEEFKSL